MTTPNSKESELQGKVVSERLRTESQQKNLSAKGGVGLGGSSVKTVEGMNESEHKFTVVVSCEEDQVMTAHPWASSRYLLTVR